MTQLENRLLQLKGELEELKIVQDEAFQICNKKREMHDLTLQFDYSEKNQEIQNRALSEYIQSTFDFVRASNDIVKRISEKRKNEFEDEINSIEKELSELLESVISAGKESYELETKAQELMSKMYDIKNEDDRKEILSEVEKARKKLNQMLNQSKKQKEKVHELIGDMNNLALKISIMTEGFDSLIEFLDGNRD